ncbi:DUF721 domain-containing protein [Verrucomicrobia bacterium]|nr:DUF721 domain-containing protein [Verrucomicrobiota bacterium]
MKKSDDNETPVKPDAHEAWKEKRQADWARRQALQQWRHFDLTNLEKGWKLKVKPTSDLVSSVLGDLRIEARRNEAEVVKVWNALIDPNVSKHAQPVKIHKGTLFVDVTNSAWLDEIVRWRRKEILRTLQGAFGKETIARISFRPAG